MGYGTYLFNLPMFYLLFGNDACLLHSVFGFSFHASFRFDFVAFVMDVGVYKMVFDLKLTSSSFGFNTPWLRGVLDPHLGEGLRIILSPR